MIKSYTNSNLLEEAKQIGGQRTKASALSGGQDDHERFFCSGHSVTSFLKRDWEGYQSP